MFGLFQVFVYVFMFLGFFTLLGFLWHVNGSPIEMFKSLPANMVDPLGGNTLSYLFVWFFIAAWTFIDPGFYQRCCAAEDVQTAKYGILISIVFLGFNNSSISTPAPYLPLEAYERTNSDFTRSNVDLL